MLREEGEQVQRSAPNECTAPASGSLWFRASFDSEVALGSLCLTANICDYVQFALVFTSIFSLCKILRLGVSQHCYILIWIGKKSTAILDMVTDNISPSVL